MITTTTEQAIFPVRMDGGDFTFSLQSEEDNTPELDEIYLTVTNCQNHLEAFEKLRWFIEAVKRRDVTFR